MQKIKFFIDFINCWSTKNTVNLVSKVCRPIYKIIMNTPGLYIPFNFSDSDNILYKILRTSLTM